MARYSIVAVLMVFLCAAGSARAAKQSFAFIDGVAGNNADDKTHEDWIIIPSFSHPVAGDKTLTGTGPTLGDLTITKTMDATSAHLQQAALDGEVFDKVQIDLVKTSPGDRVSYFQWELTNSQISSFSIIPDPIEPLEEVAFNYEQIKFIYTKLDKDGNAKGMATMTWENPDLPPMVTTEGDVEEFELITEFVAPEPATLGLVVLGALVCGRRRGHGC